MKIILFIFTSLFLSVSHIHAQILERSTLDLGGGMAKSDDIILHYSIGQPFVKTFDLMDHVVSEGFIQGFVQVMSTAIDYYPKIEAKVFPNPSYNKIVISANLPIAGSEVVLSDSSGKPMIRRRFQQFTSLEMQYLPAGQYVLQWLDQERKIVRQFKITKL